jgi:hypothetical protein
LAKPFEILLTEMRGGRVAEQLTDALDQIVQAVRITGKPGKLSVTFSIKPSGENGLAISTKVDAKPPTADVGEAFFFLTQDGGLSRTDTRQRELEFGGNVTRVPDRVMASAGD